ncbi:MAG: hypothetical protein U5K79_15875 [Cyclobacteriaceae bacterium]|nr:hypothetical protein [Cyclobacteriaceae bacterium]
MHLIGYDWAPFGVDMAVEENENTVRHVLEAGTYVWQEGATVISKSLLTGVEPLINVEHSLHVLEIMEAAHKSQDSGRRIGLVSMFPWPVVK